jgi:hypothetical protein
MRALVVLLLLPLVAIAETVTVGTGASSDDGWYNGSGPSFSITVTSSDVGYYSGNYYHACYRTDGLTVPRNSTINDVICSVQARIDYVSAPDYRFIFEDTDDASAWSTLADFGTRVNNVVSVGYDTLDVPDPGNNNWYTFSGDSLIAGLQDVVNRPGWASGQAVALFMLTLYDDGSDAYTNVYFWDNGSTARMKLTVDYTLPVSVSIAREANSDEGGASNREAETSSPRETYE